MSKLVGMAEVTEALPDNEDANVSEAQRQARLWYWASYLTENNFLVSMDSKGDLRAKCIGCGKTYEERFKWAKYHIDKCPLPSPITKVGDVIATISLPKTGDKFELAWPGPNGRKVRFVAQIVEAH